MDFNHLDPMNQPPVPEETPQPDKAPERETDGSGLPGSRPAASSEPCTPPSEAEPTIREEPLPDGLSPAPAAEEEAPRQPQTPAPQKPSSAASSVPPVSAGWESPYNTPYYYPVAPVPVKPKNKRGLRIFAGVLAAVVLLIVGVSAGFLAGRESVSDAKDDPYGWNGDREDETQNSGTQNNGTTPGSTSEFDITTGSGSSNRYSYEQIVAAVSPSIVNITVYSSGGQSGSYASGIIMDAKQGYVLTNDHIYSQVPNAQFLITLNDGTEFKASFVSGDSRSDIAILKIENPKNLTAATFSTEPLTVGQSVLAIGQSYGYADTVSEGIVSAVDRRVSLSTGSYSERYIQTTAAINPGNSGGALVNMSGQVVGVTSAKIATEDVEGLGFAIPAQTALSVVKSLQANGKVVGRAKLGITYTEIGTVLAEINNTPTGLYIQSVSEDSGLYGKGYGQGDIITHINGEEITISTIVLDIIEQSKAGDEVTLTVYKAATGKSETVTVQLAESESTNSYTTAEADALEDSQGNDLPENPFEFYYDNSNSYDYKGTP